MIANPNRHESHPILGRSGITLLEVLVAIAIVALSIGLAVPALMQMRETAARAACASHLRELAIAVHHYSDAQRHLPRGCDHPFSWKTLPRPSLFSVGLSWHTYLLPFLEQNDLWIQAWEAHQKNPGGNSSRWHAEVARQIVPGFLCPSEARQLGTNGLGAQWALGSYKGVAGTSIQRTDGVFHSDFAVRFIDITDGISTTLMIGERPPGPDGMYGAWYSRVGTSSCGLSQILAAMRQPWIPDEGINCPLSGSPLRPGQFHNACDVNHFWSLHHGGANFAFADGSVRFLRYSASDILPALATRNGGEVVEID